MPIVSVIIPTFGRPFLLRNAIQSTLNSTFLDLEILVVDDNEKEDLKTETKKIVQEFDSGVVKYLVNDRSKGGCGARNCGLINSNSDVIVFLDDDDLMVNMGIEHRLAVLDDGADFVFGRHLYVDSIYGYAIESPFESKDSFSFNDFMAGYCPATTSALMAKKAAIIGCGMFSEELESYQDYDMWLRASKKYLIKKTDQIVVEFIQHSGDRVGVNISKRIRALNVLVSKWRKEIDASGGGGIFINRMLYAAYMKNGKVLLSNKNGGRKSAFISFYNAFLLKENRRSPVIWMGLSLIGFNLTKKLLHFVKNAEGMR